jgi:hypothetical protein
MHNWLFFFSYIYFFSAKKIVRFFNVAFLSLVINKFVLGLGDSSFAHIAKKLNVENKKVLQIVDKKHMQVIYDLNG